MIGRLATRLGSVFRDSARVFWLAPTIPLIAALPEFAQHVAEIRLGMFESTEAARALASDPTRWAFGYVKIAGYVIAILVAIRFWAARADGEHWWSTKGIAWHVLGWALVLNVVIPLLVVAVERLISGLGETAVHGYQIITTLLMLPLQVLLVAGLTGDRSATVIGVYRHGWGAALRIVLFSVAVLAPLMWLHHANHSWAIGSPEPLIWGLMVFDSFVVSLLAVGWGTAIHHGYHPLSKSLKIS